VTREPCRDIFMSSASYASFSAIATATGASGLSRSRVTTEPSARVSPFRRRKSSLISVVATAQLTRLSARS
jgi:hypothetical protein